MIPGKWYKYKWTWDDNKEYYGKFLKLKGRYTVVSERNISGYSKGEFSCDVWFEGDEIKEATIEELKTFLPKDHPDLQVKKVVHCKSQQEWDFVTKKLNYTWKDYSKWSKYGNDSCINVSENSFSELTFYKTSNYTILSFEEWCKQNNYTPDWLEKNEFKKGDYVVLLTDCDGGNCWSDQIPINYCYKLRKNQNANYFYPELDIRNSKTNGWSTVPYNSKLKVRQASEEEIAEYDRLGKPYDVSTLNTKLKEDELLEEARIRYPVGTKFKSAYDLKTEKIVETTDFYWWGGTDIVADSKSGYSVYRKGKWAEIVEESKVEKWGVGTYVVALKDTEYYSFKKGYIDEITKKYANTILLKQYKSLNLKNPEDEFKWFATKEEAEEFSKTLIDSNPQFEVGRWYKINDTNKAYRKCSKIPVKDALPYSEQIELGIWRKHSSTCNGLSRVELLTDLSEIQDFLPDNHPNKISKTMKNNIKYEGRYLKALIDNPQAINISKKGDLFLIEKDNKDDTLKIKRIKDSTTWSVSRYSISVDWELMPEGFKPESELKTTSLEWKKGAYVKYKGTKSIGDEWEKYFGKYGVRAGDVGIIITYEHSDFIFVQDKIRDNSDGYLTQSDLELITKEEYERILNSKKSTKEPEIPEYVEVKNPDIWKTSIKENNGNTIFHIDFKGSKSCMREEWGRQKYNLRPSTKEAYEAQFKSNEKWIPKVGDWVVITQSGYEDQGCVQLIGKDNLNKNYFETSCDIVFNPSQFRKAEPHEIPPGKEGTKMTLTFDPDLVWEIDGGLPIKAGSGLEQIQQDFKLLDVDTSLY